MIDEALHMLKEAIDAPDSEQLRKHLEQLAPGEAARLISRLSDDEQAAILDMLPIVEATELISLLPQPLAVEILRNVPTARAAEILDRLPSDDQVDLLSELDEAHAGAVLAAMAPAEVADVERLQHYSPDTAGGLMSTEYLAFPEHALVSDVVAHLRSGAEHYARYHIQYIYVIAPDGALVGVVQPRNLLFLGDEEPLSRAVVREVVTINAAASLHDVQAYFDHYGFLAAPVVDDGKRLLGVVTRVDAEEAAAEEAEHSFMRFAGIISGEELRTMPLGTRLSRRLAWLSVTLVMNLVAASVVGLFDETLSAVIALAVFLPVISGIGGNSGNQAIAVSIRELTLGLLKPSELRWVIGKEAALASINGLALGLVLATAAFAWKGNIYLSLVVGAAQAISVLCAACLGGVLPLLLKRLEIDPALAAAPILTTLSDAIGFFLTLGFAALLLPWLV